MFNQSYLLADETLGEFYQFSRLQAMSEWWHWAAMAAVCFAVLAYVVLMYRYDSVELSRGFACTLAVLRILAFLGVLFYFFNLEKRTERKLVKNSRAVLLVDTSQSMGLKDEVAGTGSTAATGKPLATRIEQIIQEFDAGKFLNELRDRHDVVVYRFDQDNKPVEVASLAKTKPISESGGPELSAEQQFQKSLRQARITALVAGGFAFVAVFLGLVYFFVRRPHVSTDETSWTLLGSMVTLIVAVVVLAVANLQHPDVELLAMLGLKEGQFRGKDETPVAGEQPGAEDAVKAIKWSEQLAARGTQTRLGEALRYIVSKERGGPIAGITIFSDGRNNAGVEHTAGVTTAKLAEIPVFTVGMGDIRRPLNVRVVDLEAPQRVYPGDKFSLTGFIQSFGMQPGRSVTVRLASFPAGAEPQATGAVIEEEDAVQLPPEGEIVTVKFEVTPEETGRRTYQLIVEAPPQDTNANDNSKSANVEVVDRKTKVLLIAGGPTREFVFLRNFLFRDRDTTSDVWLQSGEPGISQEANELLFAFPEELDTLFEYDTIIAFDPDWTLLSDTDVQHLEQWVAEKAGGLVVVAGPVHTPQWANLRRGDPKLNTIRDLYPVSLFSSGSATLGAGRFGGEQPWPLAFSNEAEKAEFLKLDDTSTNFQDAWTSFEGVYGYYAVKDAKPGATIFSRFSDDSTRIDGELPIYMAAHFYGAGRVFFQASGEMWRLREADDSFFDQYYTKLIRWVSQGRLLRDSKRGVLLVDKDRCLLGDPITVQAILTDAQNQPLTDPEVIANLLQPDGTRATLTLRLVQDSARGGTYSGQFTAAIEGDYRVELQAPQAELEEMLVREVRVRVPELEIEKPERNDPLMQEIAEATGGRYYVGLPATLGTAAGMPPLAGQLEPQDQVTYMPGTPDRDFERQLMTWLLAVICGTLCFEWLLRRLSRLA